MMVQHLLRRIFVVKIPCTSFAWVGSVFAFPAPGGKPSRSFQVLAEYAAAHDQVSLGLVWMKVFDEAKWSLEECLGT